ncbi:iaaA, partial [Symbiodinium microadriaticum]
DECDVGPNAMQPLINFAICIHGGAGVISKSDSVSEQYTTALRDIIRRCHFFAKDDASRTAVDIAEFAVNLLENDPLFNAGIGAVFTADETHELEASIMEGTNLGCGASALLTNVKNPISLARKVMETGKHVWIAGNPGEEIAEREDLLLVESNEEFSVPRRLAQLERAKEKDGIFNDHDSAVAEEQKPGEEQKTSGDATTTTTATADSASLTEGGDIGGDKKEVFDNLDDEINTETVGCVVMRNGHLCAATSTGGMTNKCAGRIGDTPMIGCGTYANDKTCAVSATGKGEEFIRHIVAYDISARMEYCGSTLMEAAKATVFHRLPAESGGIIAVDPMGNTAMVFNSRGMFRASCNSNSEFTIGIW